MYIKVMLRNIIFEKSLQTPPYIRYSCSYRTYYVRKCNNYRRNKILKKNVKFVRK